MAVQETCPNCEMEKGVWKGNGGQGVARDGTA